MLKAASTSTGDTRNEDSGCRHTLLRALGKSCGNTYTRPLIERGIKREIEIYVTATTLLEVYNTLIWHYRVRPKKNVALKVRVVAEGLRLIPPSTNGFKISVDENVPLGDAILLATALDNKIPVIVSNDKHLRRLSRKIRIDIRESHTQKHKDADEMNA